MKTVKLTVDECGNNASIAVGKTLELLSDCKDSKIVFEKGIYHFYAEGTRKKFCAVSNNSSSDKNIVFSIEHFDGLTVDGCGSTFVFHDMVFPFAISKSRNVILENFCADRGRLAVFAICRCRIGCMKKGARLPYDIITKPWKGGVR